MPQVIVPGRIVAAETLEGVALAAAFDVAIIIIDGIILLSGGT